MDENYVKPPLGLIPRKIWLEDRRVEVMNAIARYDGVSKPIPLEWTEELNELTIQINREIERCENK